MSHTDMLGIYNESYFLEQGSTDKLTPTWLCNGQSMLDPKTSDLASPLIYRLRFNQRKVLITVKSRCTALFKHGTLILWQLSNTFEIHFL